MSFISLFEIIRVVVCEAESERRPEPSFFFFLTPASTSELAAVISNKSSGFMTDLNNGNRVFNNGPRSFPKNPPD